VDSNGRSEKPIQVTLAVAADSIQRKALQYDRAGDIHYDSISAFIKSIRGGDPDAAVYWLARMLEGGEDPRFVARRLVILASEDVGNADPAALPLAQAAADATHFVGLPECQLCLAQAAIYLACAPKSNACAKAIWFAAKDVRENRTTPVPRYLRSTPPRSAGADGDPSRYDYPHDHAGGVIAQEYLGVDRTYYEPTARGAEAAMAEHVRRMNALRGLADRVKREIIADGPTP